jgi:hypothetical protein
VSRTRRRPSAASYARDSAGYHGHIDGGVDQINGKLGDPRERFIKKYVLMESYWCESLTVRSPLDRRRKRTFTGLEATWGHVDDERERVRYARVLGLRHDPWDKRK